MGSERVNIDETEVWPRRRFRGWHKARLACCGCALIPLLYGALYFIMMSFGVLVLTIYDNVPKVAPPPEYVGVWEGTDKTLILIAHNGVASFRHGHKEIAGGRIKIQPNPRRLSITALGGGEELHIDSPPNGAQMMLSGIAYRRTAKYSTGEFGKGDDPN